MNNKNNSELSQNNNKKINKKDRLSKALRQNLLRRKQAQNAIKKDENNL